MRGLSCVVLRCPRNSWYACGAITTSERISWRRGMENVGNGGFGRGFLSRRLSTMYAAATTLAANQGIADPQH